MGGIADEDDAARGPGWWHDLLDGSEVRVDCLVEQARHRVGEIAEQLPPVLAAGACRVVGGDIRVAVHGSFSQRDGQEGAASIQQDRPRIDVRATAASSSQPVELPYPLWHEPAT
jgi:hypothetical protein